MDVVIANWIVTTADLLRGPDAVVEIQSLGRRRFQHCTSYPQSYPGPLLQRGGEEKRRGRGGQRDYVDDGNKDDDDEGGGGAELS